MRADDQQEPDGRRVARLGGTQQGRGADREQVVGAAIITQRAIRGKQLELQVRVGTGLEQQRDEFDSDGLVR
jgi:hypothetical protein